MSPKKIAEDHLWPSYKEFVRTTEAHFPVDTWEQIVLIGSGSKMDSLKFVQYLVEVEKRLQIPNQIGRGVSTPEPFRTMGSFAIHIQKILERDRPS